MIWNTYFQPYLVRWSNLGSIFFRWVGSTNNQKIISPLILIHLDDNQPASVLGPSCSREDFAADPWSPLVAGGSTKLGDQMKSWGSKGGELLTRWKGTKMVWFHSFSSMCFDTPEVADLFHVLGSNLRVRTGNAVAPQVLPLTPQSLQPNKNQLFHISHWDDSPERSRCCWWTPSPTKRCHSFWIRLFRPGAPEKHVPNTHESCGFHGDSQVGL